MMAPIRVQVKIKSRSIVLFAISRSIVLFAISRSIVLFSIVIYVPAQLQALFDVAPLFAYFNMMCVRTAWSTPSSQRTTACNRSNAIWWVSSISSTERITKWGANNIGANQIGGANEVKQAAKDRRLLATTPAVKQARNERRANNRRLATHKVKEAAKDTRFMATTTALYYCPCPCNTNVSIHYNATTNQCAISILHISYNATTMHCTVPLYISMSMQQLHCPRICNSSGGQQVQVKYKAERCRISWHAS